MPRLDVEQSIENGSEPGKADDHGVETPGVRRRHQLWFGLSSVFIYIATPRVRRAPPVFRRILHPPSPAPTRFADYETKTELHLPFSSDAAFGRPIVAPADAVVAAVVAETVDGLPDNTPGETDAKHPAGNHVTLDFGNGEFGLLAHFRGGSVAVKTGDHVSRGQVLAACGNSGNTSQPHLHFHLQNTARLDACGTPEGLPAFFVDYAADGKPVARGEPVKDEVVSAR